MQPHAKANKLGPWLKREPSSPIWNRATLGEMDSISNMMQSKAMSFKIPWTKGILRLGGFQGVEGNSTPCDSIQPSFHARETDRDSTTNLLCSCKGKRLIVFPAETWISADYHIFFFVRDKIERSCPELVERSAVKESGTYQ